jgi:HD-like signal output (HDOD) protein
MADLQLPTAEALVANLRDLPALPTVLTDLIASLSEEDVDSTTIARKILDDPALASSTLRVANSPFFGMRGSIHSIKDAIIVLGLRCVRSMALANGLSAAFQIHENVLPDIQGFWQNAYDTAAAARVLAPPDGESQNDALLGGLLHDIGILALAVLRPDLCLAIREHVKQRGCDWTSAEDELGVPHHGIVGGALAQRWNFPKSLCAVITHHHGPTATGGRVAAAVHIADILAHAAAVLNGASQRPPMINEDAWQMVNPSPALLLSAARAIRDASTGPRWS